MLAVSSSVRKEPIGTVNDCDVEDQLDAAAVLNVLVGDGGERQGWATIRGGLSAGLRPPMDLRRVRQLASLEISDEGRRDGAEARSSAQTVPTASTGIACVRDPGMTLWAIPGGTRIFAKDLFGDFSRYIAAARKAYGERW